MRSISGNLAAAQKASVRRPYLHVTISDRHAGIRRLRWAQWYAGAEPDNGHAAVVAADGSLTPAPLYRPRVPTPVIGSTYSSWTAWTPPITPKANLIAFTKAGSTLWAFIVNNATPTQVYKATSADDGATLDANRWNGSTWTEYAGPPTPAFNGVAVHYSGDWNVIATAEDTTAT